MIQKGRFDDAVDAVDRLPPDEQAELVRLFRRRLMERGHARVVAEVTAARQEIAAGLAEPLDVDALMRELEDPIPQRGFAMTSAVRDLVRSFRALSDAEKHEAANLLLRHLIEVDQGDVGDTALVVIAEELFRELETHEADDAHPDAR